MTRGTPGDNYNLKTAAIAAHDASYVLYRTGILSSGYATDSSDVNFYNLTLNNKLHVKGDFHVDGSMTEIYSSRLDISDGLIELATSNPSDTIDIGFYGRYDLGGDDVRYAGLYREKSDGDFKLFKNLAARPNQIGVVPDTSYAIAKLHADVSATILDATTLIATTANITNFTATDISTNQLRVGGSIISMSGGAVENADFASSATSGGDIDLSLNQLASDISDLDIFVTTGTMTIGGSTATSIDIASSGVMTTVEGALTVTQDASFNGDVKFNEHVDVSGTLDVSGNTTLDGTLNVTGNTTLNTLSVGGIDTIYGAAATIMRIGHMNANPIQISRSGVITRVKGTLRVAQDASFNGDVEFNENVDVSGTLDVTGLTSVTTLNSTGQTTLASTGGTVNIATLGALTNVNGMLNVVDAVTLGSTLDVAGTLDVSGNTTLDGTLNVTQDASFNGDVKFNEHVDVSGTLDVSGNTTLDGTLNVSDAVTLDSTLDVTGDTTIDGTLNSTGQTTLASGGGTVNIASLGHLTKVNGTLNVVDAVTLDSTLDVAGTLDVSGNTTLDGTLNVTQDASFNGDVKFNEHVDVSGTLDVSGNTTLDGTLNVSDAVTLDSTLDVTGDTTIDGILTVNGTNINGSNVRLAVKTIIATSSITSNNGGITAKQGGVTIERDGMDCEGDIKVTGGAVWGGGNIYVLGDGNTGESSQGRSKGNMYAQTDISAGRNIYAHGDITAFYGQSDRRLKKNVETIDDALSIINNLRGVRFDWNEEAQKLNKNVDLNKRELGVIAQEIEKELPEVIKDGLEGYMAVRYEKITPLLIQCIKEQQMMIKQQDERISKLENSQN